MDAEQLILFISHLQVSEEIACEFLSEGLCQSVSFWGPC